MTSITSKRKLTDYFSTQPSKKVATDPAPVSTLNHPLTVNSKPSSGASKTYVVQQIDTVPGLELWTDFVTLPEQDLILDFLNDPAQCTWRTDLSRRTMHFGGDYCIMPPRPSKADLAAGIKPPKPEIVAAPPVPRELMWLLDRMNQQGIYKQGEQPQYCIV